MDKDLLDRVRGAITRATHIDLKKTPIHVAYEGDTIVIEGDVERAAYKKKALKAAMEVVGPAGLIDRLRVIPAKVMGDKEIRKHIFDGLEEEPTIDAGTIDVGVEKGVVDLEGKVHSLIQKRLVGLIAWWVPGTRDVINSLEVDPPEDDSDSEVTEAVKLALEKDRIVDHTSISVTTKNWIVTLSGSVKDEIEREAVEDDAWYIWGVDDVINNIEVIP